MSYDKRAGCWTTNALGEMVTGKTGRAYRLKSYFRDCTHPTKDRRKAEDQLSAGLKEQQQAAAIGASARSDPTLDDLSSLYLTAAEPELSAESYTRRVEQLNRVLDWPGRDHPGRLGRLRAADFGRDDLVPFLDAMRAAGLSSAYINNSLLMAIKRMMSWACEVTPKQYPGLPLVFNPLARMKGVPATRRAHRPLEELAASRFVRFVWRRALGAEGLTRRFGQMAAILLYALHKTGARPKEFCVAEWSDLRPGPDGWGLLLLPSWKHKTGKKTGRDRQIAIPPDVLRRIEWIRGLHGRHPEFIFTHRRGRGRGEIGTAEAGESWTWVDRQSQRIGDTKMWQQYVGRLVDQAEAAGLALPAGFRQYWLRSRYSTDAQRRGVPRALLANSMGTSELMLERNYTDLDAADVFDAARRARGDGPTT